MHIYYKYQKFIVKMEMLYYIYLLAAYLQDQQPKRMNDECTYRFSNFLIIFLCNSSANCRFYIISILIAPLKNFLSNTL